MTYFSVETKKLGHEQKQSRSLGPGSYSVQKSLSKSSSYAPFGSLIKKVLTVKNPRDPLGPGSYNINRDLTKPNIMQYENDNCIIIKINEEGGSQFRSKQQRFKEVIANTPGPGQYDNLNKSKTVGSKRTKSVGFAVNKMKDLYESEYASKRKPTLTSDAPIVQEKAEMKQSIKGITKWSLDRGNRFKTQQKQTFNDEDKSILLDKVSLQNKKQRIGQKQSSFFASKSVKSSFDEIIYKTTNPFKVQIRKMLGFEDQSPGPGSYDAASLTSKKKIPKFQFFGSTVGRFESKQEKEGLLGPGQYEVDPHRQQRRISKPKKRAKTIKTMPNQIENEQKLGPGCYDTEVRSTYKPTFNKKYQTGVADFGSQRPRFATEYSQKKENKSQYISFMAQQDQERKKKIQLEFNFRRNALRNKNHGIFLSESKRNCFPQNEQKIKNPFGKYEIGMEDIGARVKKQQQLSNHFHECHLQKPGFMSSVQRFQIQKTQQPGHKDCWCQIKQVQKKNIQHMSPSFQSNCRRTEVFEAKSKAPPVGQYTKQSTFIKQSFNSRFIKQNQNKSKKLKIWKAKEQ